MYNNKLAHVLLLLFCLSVSGLASSQPVRYNLTEKAWLDQHQILRVGVVELTPPLLSYAGRRNPQGLVADYLRAVVLHLGLQLEIILYPNQKDLLRGLREGEVDALGAWSVALEDQGVIRLTRPYLSLPLALYGASEVPASGLRGLRGKSLAVMDATGLKKIRNIVPGLGMVVVSTLEQGLHKAARGEVYAYLGDAASVDYLLKRQSIDDLELQLQLDMTYDLSLATLSSNTALLGLLQKGLDRIAPDEMQEIWNRWPGVDRPQHYASEIDLWWLWLLLFASWSVFLVWGVNRYVLYKEQHYVYKLKRAIRRLQRREKALKEKLVSLNDKARAYQGLNRDQRQRLDLLNQVLPSAAWVWRPGTAECQWDDRMYELFGQDPEQFGPTPDTILERVHADDRQAVAALFQKPDEETECRLSFRILLPDGEIRWLLDFSEFSDDQANGEQHRVGLCWDATDFLLDDRLALREQSVES
jgi:ABC-type amino acid transport substrate-binding protein